MDKGFFQGLHAERWRILDGDCLAYCTNVEPGHVELVFADPPYNQGFKYRSHDDCMPVDVYRSWLHLRLVSAASLLNRDSGSMFVLLSWEHIARTIVALENIGMHVIQWITWHETFGNNCTTKFNRCSRPLVWLAWNKNVRIRNPDDPLLRQPSARAAVYNDKRAKQATKVLDDVWTIPRLAGTHKERHDWANTQLPLALLRRVIACATNPGDIVLDPFSGSGTTVAAAIEMDRLAIGFEIDETSVRNSRQRCEETSHARTLV